MGEYVDIGGIKFKVVGVYSDPGGEREEARIFIPLSTAQRVYNAGPTAELTPTVNGLITIPVTATVGITRMRITIVEGGNGSLNPCATYTWGETEDYVLKKELKSELNNQTYYPETYFIDNLRCIE